MDRADRTRLAAKAYIYGFPTVFTLEQAQRHQRDHVTSEGAR